PKPQRKWLRLTPAGTFPRLPQGLLRRLVFQFMIDSETVLASGVLKLSTSRDALAERLGLVARGVSTRTAVLVLGGIQLRAAQGRLQLAAADMGLSVRASRDAEVGAGGGG